LRLYGLAANSCGSAQAIEIEGGVAIAPLTDNAHALPS
jgi:hypothetical protein